VAAALRAACGARLVWLCFASVPNFMLTRMPVQSDTSPEAERIIIDGLRRMSPAQKLERVSAINRALDALVTARLRAQYNPTPTELRLRLAALRLDASVMRDAFQWDPSIRGL